MVLAFGNEKIKPVPAGSAQDIGTSVFRIWVLPFEVLSVLLLAALIGAIVLSCASELSGRDLTSAPGRLRRRGT